jgi:hypothetical protein
VDFFFRPAERFFLVEREREEDLRGNNSEILWCEFKINLRGS